MSAPDASRPLAWAGLAAILVLVAIAFGPALRGELLGDDLPLLSQAAAPGARPAEYLVLELTQRLAGVRPIAFHAVSLTAHLLATAAVFVLALRLAQRASIALAAAALFGLHPVHAESVARISALHAPLSSLFALLALCVHAGGNSREPASPMRIATTAALFVCGLLADGAAIAFLPMAVILDAYGARRDAGRARLAAPAVYGACAALWLALAPSAPRAPELGVGFARLALLRVEVLGQAFQQLVWPFGAEITHPFRPEIAWSDPHLVLGVGGVAALVAALWWLHARRRTSAFVALLVFAASLFEPLCVAHARGTFPLGGEQLHLPAAGVALFVAHAATARAGAAITTALAIAFGAQAYARTQIWRSDFTLLTAAVGEHPESPTLQWRLGRAQLREYTERGSSDQLTAAGRTFESALDLLSRVQQGDRSIFAVSDDFLQSNLGLGWSLLFQSEHDPYGVDDTAHRVFEMVVARYPRSAEAHMARGVSALAMGRLDEAESAFEKSLELRPGNAEALHNLGQLLVRRRDWAGAIAAFERALRSRPDHLDDLVSLARALAESGQEPRAIEIADRAARIDPLSPLPAVVRGTLEARRGAFDSALSWVDRALALDPDDGEAFLLRGKILLARGELHGARTAFERAADRLPQSFEAHYNLAALRLKDGDHAAALPHLVHAYTLRPPGVASEELRRSLADIGIRSPDTHLRLATSDVARGELEAAADWLDRALDLDSGHGPSHMLRAHVSEARGDVDGAIAALERACQAMPESYPAHLALGETLVKTGRTSEGLAYLERALSIATKANARDPDSAGALEGLRRRIDEVRSKAP